MTPAQKQRSDHVLRLAHEDWPISAIARETGAAKETVRRILHQANYTPAMAAAARKRREETQAAAQRANGAAERDTTSARLP